MKCPRLISQDLITHLKVPRVLEGSPETHRSCSLMVAKHWKASRRQSQYCRPSHIGILQWVTIDWKPTGKSHPHLLVSSCRSHKPEVTYLLMMMMMIMKIIIESSNNINFQIMCVCYTLGHHARYFKWIICNFHNIHILNRSFIHFISFYCTLPASQAWLSWQQWMNPSQNCGSGRRGKPTVAYAEMNSNHTLRLVLCRAEQVTEQKEVEMEGWAYLR